MMPKLLPKHGEKIEISAPYEVDFTTADGIFIKQVSVRNAGTMLPQHSHVYDHTSFIAKGAVFLWKDGQLDKRYEAPTAILIKADVKHLFMTLTDDTTILCIHNLHNEDVVKVLAKHDLSEYNLQDWIGII